MRPGPRLPPLRPPQSLIHIFRCVGDPVRGRLPSIWKAVVAWLKGKHLPRSSWEAKACPCAASRCRLYTPYMVAMVSTGQGLGRFVPVVVRLMVLGAAGLHGPGISCRCVRATARRAPRGLVLHVYARWGGGARYQGKGGQGAADEKMLGLQSTVARHRLRPVPYGACWDALHTLSHLSRL